MPQSTPPSKPVEAYKEIIDQLVNETSHSGPSRRIEEKGVFSNAAVHQPFNEFIRTLSADQRNLLAKMFQEERASTIHDVLAVLTWWINTREVGLTYRGKPMPVELSGMGLHGDYVGRRDGWNWPDSSDSDA